MRTTDIKVLSIPIDEKTKLKHKQKNLAICVSLAAGMAWKEKIESFYPIIAKELLEIFDQHLLGDIELKSFRKNYIRIYIDEKTVFFNQNNLLLNTYEKISLQDWLKQELLIMENKELPKYLTSKEKEELFQNLTREEIQIVNRNYSRQELNSDRFPISLQKEEQDKLTDILTKANYFSLSVYDYIKEVAKGKYQYILDTQDEKVIFFKKTYDNYILEIGAYISKVIEEYVNKDH